MGLEIANVESYVKYAGATRPRTPVGNELRKFYSGDKANVDSFIKSITKPKVKLPSDVVNSAAKSIEKGGMFLKYSGGEKNVLEEIWEHHHQATCKIVELLPMCQIVQCRLKA